MEMLLTLTRAVLCGGRGKPGESYYKTEWEERKRNGEKEFCYKVQQGNAMVSID